MLNIALLPLDERPCNYAFPSRLFEREDIHIEKPVSLSERKRPADRRDIEAFLEKAFSTCDALILSMDMYLYGGLIPSRLHHITEKELNERFDWFVALRKRYPQVPVYTFQCIMRCPDYSSSGEEPDYYGILGKEIHDLGVGLHMEEKGLESPFDINVLKDRIGKDALSDYFRRRDLNLKMNQKTLQLLHDGMIDALVIPQDDSSVYGFSALDKEAIQKDIRALNLEDKVLTYPGADEVELTLISRFLNEKNGRSPKIYVRYINEASKKLVPLYEGQPLENTVAAHLISAGCTQVSSLSEADAIIALTGPGADMLEADMQNRENFVDISAADKEELLTFLKEQVEKGIPVIISDNEYANGGDIALIDRLDKEGLLFKIGGYAGWNTNANTLGTAIAQSVNLILYGSSVQQQDFLLERYLEDGAYCGQVRGHLLDIVESIRIPILSDEDISDMEKSLSDELQKKMLSFTNEHLSSIASRCEIKHISFPWHRLFEVNLIASLKEN